MSVNLLTYYGVYRSLQTERKLEILQRFFIQFNICFLDSESVMIAGKICADLAAIVTSIVPYDWQIAVSAIARNFILVTHNRKPYNSYGNITATNKWNLRNYESSAIATASFR